MRQYPATKGCDVLRRQVPPEMLDPSLSAPWAVGEGKRAVLLLHGFGGTPPELRVVGEAMAARGWRCYAPLMAGHGATLHDMAASDWTGWVRSAQLPLQALLMECEEVAVVGQSMGALVALHLAAHNPAISSVAVMSTPLLPPSLQSRLLPFVKWAFPWYVPDGTNDLWRKDGILDLHNYSTHSVRSVGELMRMTHAVIHELPSVRAPVLIVHGSRDTLAAPSHSQRLERLLVASSDVDRVEFPRSGHGISVDVDRFDVADRIAQWCEAHGVSPSTVHGAVSERVAQ